MVFKIKIELPQDFFTQETSKTDRLSARHKVRVVIKEKGGNWQDTVLFCKGGLPEGTEIVLTCFPGKNISHQLVRVLSSTKDLSELEASWFEAESELVEILQANHRLEENRNTSPVAVSEPKFDEWYRFVNEKIWIKFHLPGNQLLKEAHAKLMITPEEWHRYQMVNRKYAKALARDILDDVVAGRDIALDLNWLHDYQLMLVFSFLQEYLHALVEELGLKKNEEEVKSRFSEEEKETLYAKLPYVIQTLNTSYFHHIPWPSRETFVAQFPEIMAMETSGYESDNSDIDLPLANTWEHPEYKTGQAIVDGLLAANHVAFQTSKDAQNFLECVYHYYPDATIDFINDQYSKVTLSPDKIIKVCVNPIGTDYDRFANMDLGDASLIQYIGEQLGCTIAWDEGSSEEIFEKRLEELTYSIREAYLKSLADAFKNAFTLENTFDIQKFLSLEKLEPEEIDDVKKALFEESLTKIDGCSEEKLVQGIEKLFETARQAITQLNKISADLCHDHAHMQSLQAFKAQNPKAQLITSIGRLDPAKNVPAVLDAYHTYLAQCFRDKKPIKNALLLFIVPSRLEVTAYQSELKTILGKYDDICNLLAENEYAPEQWIHLADEEKLKDFHQNPPTEPKLTTPNAMTEFYRFGNVIVSSSADGMNLVVKEWVAAQDGVITNCLQDLAAFIADYPESTEQVMMSASEADWFDTYASALQSTIDEALLKKLQFNFTAILGEFFAQYEKPIPELPLLSINAGAAYQLKDARLIDPWDVGGIVEAFHDMATLGLIERVARALRLKKNVSEENGRHWRRSIIDRGLEEAMGRSQEFLNPLHNSKGACGHWVRQASQQALRGSKQSFFAENWQKFANSLHDASIAREHLVTHVTKQ